MELLVKLLTAHAIGDGALQTPYMAVNKSTNSIAMSAHCLTVAGVFYLITGSVGAFWITFVSHFIIDSVSTVFKKNLVWDQFLHLIIICLLWIGLNGL